MNASVIRLIAGLVVLILSWRMWSRLQAASQAGEDVQLLGSSYDPGSAMLMTGLGVIALIGVLFLIFGLVGVLGKPR